MGYGLVFMKIGKRLLHILGSVYLIDIFDVLRAHLVDDVGTVGLISVVMSLVLEKTELTCFTKLSRGFLTYLRLLLRFQLSSPRLESGSLGLLPSLR
jgi:hypothetical protein